ncbi:SusC/RagA family TonB-linked outer membrane protein [Pedobacter psychroterrae]|uniref:TonB-dependent receptor n=1 Tax=Pedobacter psychroterrae TaxID=2530453 RepID=A0A4R0NLE5_9SPHI|nr:TonB-dependent receptor [Pedobacter psychroterrae]TCD00343.1 TonB-dependent receptor [Pedobacter psychroterrae]
MSKRITQIFLIAIMLMLPAAMMAQTVNVTGKITDQSDGTPLPGVTIKVQGTNIGTSTDASGNFSIQVAIGAKLVISSVGMIMKTISVTSPGPLEIKMAQDAEALGEVVVVGYGTQKKSVVTGAISSVKAADLDNQPVTRIEQSLQGRTSGLTIASNSGQPGAASTVRLRGFTSFGNGKNEPLWVVDGVVIDNGGIGYLNQDDIESLEVLKDAASAAIYGTRAAAGVILITTKKGKAGAIDINYSNYFGTQAPAKKLDLLNATQYATLRNQAFSNNAANAGKPLPFPDAASLGEGTDWQDIAFNNSANKQIHEFNVSGGNEKVTFFSSFSYYDIEGIVASPISKANRANVRINSTYKPAKWISFGENLGYAHGVNSGVGETNREYGGVLSSAINLDPITPAIITDPASQAAFFPAAPIGGAPASAAYKAALRDSQGRFYGVSPYVANEMRNPLAYIQSRLGNYGWDHNIIGNVFLDLEPIKGLKFHSSLGTKLSFYGGDSFNPTTYFNTSSSIQPNSFQRVNNYLINWNLENTLSYNHVYNKHNITLLVGHGEYKDNNARGTTVTYSNIPATRFNEASFRFPTLPANRTSEGRDGTDHRINSLFSRIQYNYDEKYLFTALIRRDGSSRFGANNQYGFFPSASVGWVPTLESFFPENSVVNFLKIRASYGVTGNDGIGDFAFVPLVDAGGQRNYTFGTSNVESIVLGYSPAAPANPDLKWEETSQLDIGFDATLLQNLSLTVDVYNKKTKGILQNPPIPGYAGYGSFAQNIADIENKGLEFELGYRKKFGELDFGLNGNVSFYKNKVTKLIAGTTFLNDNNATFQTLGDITRTGLDRAYNQFFGYETLGIFQSQAEVDAHLGADGVTKLQPNSKPGDLKYANLQEDNTINGDDRTYLGNPNPTMSYGLTLNLGYKNFDLTAFGSGAGGNKIFQGLRRLDIATSNYQEKYLDAWTPTNTAAKLPRLSEGEATNNYTRFTSLYLEDGDYFRLRTLQLGYSFPTSIMNKVKIKKLRVYVLAENLFTSTKYSGYDPELGVSADSGGGAVYSVDRGVYPQARTFLFGLNVGF